MDNNLAFGVLLHAQTDVNPMNKCERITKHAVCVTIEPSSEPDTVWLKGIRSLVPLEGRGSAALDWICALADECGVRIICTPKPFGLNFTKRNNIPPLGKKALVAWYERHGFVAVDRRWMSRPPKILQNVSS